ncbi:MAG TPA: FkbM family methyltransferase [Burkholderiales bacterium]|jgi:FkbM family methyltransferase|nr:FkbM family methyltransferase [Burkholderiales bacterium]
MPSASADPATLLSANPALEARLTRHGPMLYFAHDAYIGASLREYGEFSELEFDMLRQLLRPGDIVVEAGANIGALTIPIARAVGATGAVYAIEAQRRVFQVLCANVALSGLPHVRTLHAAATATGSPLQVPELDYAAPNNFGGISLVTGGAGETVQPLAIDSLELAACRMIKADVEGMEHDVLESARATVARCRPLLYVENDRRDKSPALLELIHSYGYRMWWHAPPLYNPANFAANPVNLMQSIVSLNLICVPLEINFQFEGGQEVAGPQDFPEIGNA